MEDLYSAENFTIFGAVSTGYNRFLRAQSKSTLYFMGDYWRLSAGAKIFYNSALIDLLIYILK